MAKKWIQGAIKRPGAFRKKQRKQVCPHLLMQVKYFQKEVKLQLVQRDKHL